MNFDPRDLLAAPKIYRLFSDFVAGPRARKRIVDEFVRPMTEDKILDIGCGPGSMRAYLPCADYCGVDISQKYIDAARARHGEKGRFIVRAVTDNTCLQDLGTFDLVMAIGLLHHLEDVGASSLFKAAKDVLRPGGRVLTLDNVFVPEQSMSARWIIGLDRGKHVRTREGYVSLAAQHFQDMRVTIRHDLLRIPYTHIIMECRQGDR